MEQITLATPIGRVDTRPMSQLQKTLFMFSTEGDLDDDKTDALLDGLKELGASVGVVTDAILVGDLNDSSVRYAPVGQIAADAAGW